MERRKEIAEKLATAFIFGAFVLFCMFMWDQGEAARDSEMNLAMGLDPNAAYLEYIASKTQGVFHDFGADYCTKALKLGLSDILAGLNAEPDTDIRFFASIDEALAAGYKRCPDCLPEYQW